MNRKRGTRSNVKPQSVRVATGEYGDVVLIGDALSEYQSLQIRARANADTTSVREERTLTRYFERYASLGPSSLSDKMYKPQKRVSMGDGSSVFVFEFKAYQFRIYGVEFSLNGRRTFLGTACEPSKKRDKADSKTIAKAADVYWEYKK